MIRSVFLAVVWALILSTAAVADTENSYQFDSEQQRETYHQLTKELRCPKCQNQNIADSHAPLAEDMRDRTYQMLKEGQSREQIIDFMVARYGDFVHYQPPFTAATSILWWGPVLIVLIGLVLAFSLTRKRNNNTELTSEERERLEQLRKSGNE